MFSMTIVFGESPVPWMLLFKSNEAIDAAAAELKNPATFGQDQIEIVDDFGQHVLIKRSSIHGIMFEDMSQSKLAQIERGMHQVRTQIEANNLVKSDPILWAAMRASQPGPGVITPFGANGAFRQ